MNHDRKGEYRQALRDLRNAENYFNVCESRFISYAILSLCYAENRVNEILKELRHVDTPISQNKEPR